MRTITAQKIASNWHGGQWSSFYQFSSSGIYVKENHLQYLKECEDCLHPEYNLHPSELSKKDLKNLTDLKNYFIKEGEKHEIKTEYMKNTWYGYLVPTATTPQNIEFKKLQYPI